MSAAARELVVNVVLLVAAAGYLVYATRHKKDRTFIVTVLVLGFVGLWFNLHGEYISGWQNGFHVGGR